MASTFTFHGSIENDFLHSFAEGIKNIFVSRGYEFADDPIHPRLVFNFTHPQTLRPYRRKAQATFVVTVVEAEKEPDHLLKAAYPYLIRSLSNHLIYIVHKKEKTHFYFLTPEQGCYEMTFVRDTDPYPFYQKVYERLEPLASSHLVINNDFRDDLPQSLWEGDEITEQINKAGKKLDHMNLLPAPFPIHEYLTPRDLKHLRRLYGIGGLSYGNLSSRKDEQNFWMSASGVDKSNLSEVGKDVLFIKGYNAEKQAMRLSVPPDRSPRRASVDAIEHWMIYREHPEVGAVVHIHAWMENVRATEINYPCGTYELATTVASLIREQDDPSRAVIGLKNHGLTITGRDLDDIFERIEGRILPQVPMS